MNEPRKTSLLRPAKSWPMPAASKAPLVPIQTVEAPLRWVATLLLATVLAVALAACSDDSSGSGESGIDPHFPYQPCRACRNQQQNYLM